MIFGGMQAEMRITADDLRRLRKDHGWSQGDLAERLGVSTSTVQAWERGARATPAMLTLALIGLDLLEREPL